MTEQNILNEEIKKYIIKNINRIPYICINYYN